MDCLLSCHLSLKDEKKDNTTRTSHTTRMQLDSNMNGFRNNASIADCIASFYSNEKVSVPVFIAIKGSHERAKELAILAELKLE